MDGLNGPRLLSRDPPLVLAITRYKLHEYPPSPLEWRRYGGYGPIRLAAHQISNLVDYCIDDNIPLGFGQMFPVYQTQLMLDRRGGRIQHGRLVSDAVVVCVPGLVRSSRIDVSDDV